MTNDTTMNPGTVGILTAAIHYAAARRAKRENGPEHSVEDLERLIGHALHNDAAANAMWYALVDRILTAPERAEEAKRCREEKYAELCKTFDAMRTDPQRTVMLSDERLPHYGPSPLMANYRRFHMARILSEAEHQHSLAVTEPTPVSDDPQPITILVPLQ